MASKVDPGYGDPKAPKGTVEWAKRWRLDFQGVAKDLPSAPRMGKHFYEIGNEYRAWTLITDGEGKTFPNWESFCACPEPYGLGMLPEDFAKYVKPEIGDKTFDLMTVAPDARASRDRDGEGQFKPASIPVSDTGMDGPCQRKKEKLRAILRAPEVVQDLYRVGKISQATAAKLGPKSPTPEKAAQIAEARQVIEKLDTGMPTREYRKEADTAVREVLGLARPTPLEQVKRLLPKLSPAERAEVRQLLTPKESS